jgi:hypothetical protein
MLELTGGSVSTKEGVTLVLMFITLHCAVCEYSVHSLFPSVYRWKIWNGAQMYWNKEYQDNICLRKCNHLPYVISTFIPRTVMRN